MRILAIDFGERRVGLALSDPEERLAVPLDTLLRRSDRELIEQLREVVQKEEVDALLLGEPLTLEGERGPAALRVRRFGRRLAAATELPLSFAEETLTSVEAERRLREAGVGPARRKERIDAVAAQVLLEQELERRRSGSPS